MERTCTAGGTDVTQESQRYKWLKKLLKARLGPGVVDIDSLTSVGELRLCGMQHGILTVQPLDAPDSVEDIGRALCAHLEELCEAKQVEAECINISPP